jgi:hypothetical protein
MGASCSSTATPRISPPPRTQRQLTAFINDDDEDETDEVPRLHSRGRSESVREEDMKRHIATMAKEAPPMQRQESSKRVRFQRQQELVKIYEYTPDALLLK